MKLISSKKIYNEDEKKNPIKNSTSLTINYIRKKNSNNIELNERRKKRFISHIAKNSLNFMNENLGNSSPKRDKRNSRQSNNFLQEEISGYALLNYHLEVNDNMNL